MSRIVPLVSLLAAIALPASAQTPLERYIEADLSINNGDGYKTSNNETATLGWGESYIMMSYASAYLATDDTFFLDKLADHADFAAPSAPRPASSSTSSIPRVSHAHSRSVSTSRAKSTSITSAERATTTAIRERRVAGFASPP